MPRIMAKHEQADSANKNTRRVTVIGLLLVLVSMENPKCVVEARGLREAINTLRLAFSTRVG